MIYNEKKGFLHRGGFQWRTMVEKAQGGESSGPEALNQKPDGIKGGLEWLVRLGPPSSAACRS